MSGRKELLQTSILQAVPSAKKSMQAELSIHPELLSIALLLPQPVHRLALFPAIHRKSR
jgi:hypothetical protein